MGTKLRKAHNMAIQNNAGIDHVRRGLTRLAAYFDLTELYEVSFNAGRIK